MRDVMIKPYFRFKQSKHFRQRRSQRGIKQSYVDLALTYGREVGDKIILDRMACRWALGVGDHQEGEEQDLLHIMSMGGYVIVKNESTLITTYRRNSYSRKLAKTPRTGHC